MTDVRRITEALGGHWYGTYGLAFCPAHHNKNTPALCLANGNGGRLLASCKAGCGFSAVVAALRGLGLLEVGSASFAPDPVPIAKRQASDKMEMAKRAAQAARLWKETSPLLGTVAETYLRGRGIMCDLPSTLRFAPSCWHATTSRFPAIVALVEGSAAFAVHRTYLAPDGDGKAAVDPPKAMLGSVFGGAIRLVEQDGPLVVAEGIETALSLACGILRYPATIWAALSAPGLQTLHLPTKPARLVIASDGDKVGRKAAHALADRAHTLGWAVSLLPAPEGADWNDVLAGKAALS